MELLKPQYEIETITQEILNLQNETTKNCIEIGKRLLYAKDLLQHGEWLSWLKEKVDFSERTAQRFMTVAKEFPNTTTLSFSKLLLLLYIPTDERAEFINKSFAINVTTKTVNEMTTRELSNVVKIYKPKPQYFSNSEFTDKCSNLIDSAKELGKYLRANQVSIEPNDIKDICHRLQQTIKELRRIDNKLSDAKSWKYYDCQA